MRVQVEDAKRTFHHYYCVKRSPNEIIVIKDFHSHKELVATSAQTKKYAVFVLWMSNDCTTQDMKPDMPPSF